MTIRTFIFCDVCNTQAVRNIYEDRQDRRNSDGRSWFEGRLEEAVRLGWRVLNNGDILCPHCIENKKILLVTENKWNANNIKFNT